MSRSAMGRYAPWFGIVLLAFYLVFLGGAWQGIYNTYVRQASVLLAGAALTVWIAAAIRSRTWQPRSVLLPAIGAALLSLTLSTATSRAPRQSIEYLGYAILLAACYLLLVRILAVEFFRARMETLAVTFAAVIGGAFVVANVAHWIDWWGVVGRITLPPLRPDSESLTYGNPSAVLTIVLLFWCSSAAAIGLGSRARQAVVAGLGLLTLFAIIVSGSRAGWFAIGIAVIGLALAWLAAAGRRRDLVTRARAWLSIPAGRITSAAIAVGVAAVLLVLAPTLGTRLTLGGADLRSDYIIAALRMFADAPILGTGPGTWVILRTRYTFSPQTDYYIPHAHDIYAQTLAELGVAGALAGVVLLASLVWLVRGGIHDADPARRRWGWAAAFGLSYFGAHQLLDFYANMPAVLFAAALPVAWLDATGTRRPNVASRPWPVAFGRVPAIVAVALVALSVAGLLITEVPAQLESSAVVSANDGAWAAADPPARDALALDPSWSPYRLTMGLAAAHVGDHQRAADAFRSVAESDDLPEAWLDLAAEETILGDTDAARRALHRAGRLGLQEPAAAMAIGDLASRLGDSTLEAQAFSAAIAEVPSLAGDPWWQAEPARVALFAQVLDGTIRTADPSVGWQIALAAGDVNRARALAASSRGGSGTVAADRIIDAWTGSAEALDRILTTCDDHPLDTWCLTWAARLEGRRGNVAAANRYRQWASTVSAGADVAGSELRVSGQELIGRTIQGSVEDFWGTYTYRRPTPWNRLVPSLVQLTLA